jgi:ribosomal protein L37E
MDAKGFQFRITGPPPRPDVAYRVARERAEAIDASITQALQQRAQHQATIATRADTNTACPGCGSGIYDAAYGYCPSCGFERVHNGHAILDQRSATPTTPTPKCGHCGIPWEQCIHGYHAQGRT